MGHYKLRAKHAAQRVQSMYPWSRRLLHADIAVLKYLFFILLVTASQTSCQDATSQTEPLPAEDDSAGGVVTTGTQPAAVGGSTQPQTPSQSVPEHIPQSLAAIKSLGTLAAKPGEQVEVHGFNLRPGLTAWFEKIAVELKVSTTTTASFVMPEGVRVGLVDVDFKFEDKDVQRLSLISDSAGDHLPIMLIDPSQVCQDISYRDAKGDVKQGQRVCSGATPAACTADGQTNCMTTSRYKAMDTDASVISAWDIRKGKTAGGLAGEIVFYQNMANTSIYDRTSGTSAVPGVDKYDTLDDHNDNGGSIPTQNPTGWNQATGANWLRDSVSDTGEGGGVALDGICNGSESCVYKDRLTGLYWSREITSSTWETAITSCEESTSGGYSDWRLPTQKEMMQAYTNGLWNLRAASKLNLTMAYYWSSTTRSYDGYTNAAWVLGFFNGAAANYDKTTTLRVVCVR